MLARVSILLTALVLIVFSGCKPGKDATPAPPPVTPAFPTAAPADPQQLFDQWKDLVLHPEKIGGGSMHGELAWNLTEKDPSYADKMIDLLVDPTTPPESRFLILNSLEVAQIPSTYPRLIELTKPEVDPTLRTQVTIMLGKINEPSAAARIRELADDPERRVRLAALLTLVGGGDQEMRTKLQEYYFSDGLPPEHRTQIVLTLAAVPSASDITVFGAALNDASLGEDGRMVACNALGRTGDPSALEPLRQCAGGENPPILKEAAANAVKAIEDKTPAAGAGEAK